MSSDLKKSAQKVQQALDAFGFELRVKEFAESTRTSQEAADAIGCTVGQIAKSLIFKGKDSQSPILVIASGANRVNEKAVKAHLGEKLEKADAAFVLEHTGYAIGGIPPYPADIGGDDQRGSAGSEEVAKIKGQPQVNGNALFSVKPYSR
jgi:prolyl-tRNA editing enzyme YbaK/EbsC (Cys-tRNA(Pro) deacylase)